MSSPCSMAQSVQTTQHSDTGALNEAVRNAFPTAEHDIAKGQCQMINMLKMQPL